MNIGSIKLPNEKLIGEAAAVLGIRGSGKTNTAAVLIEELLESGMPLSIVDIEGEYWGLKEKYQILVIGDSEHADIITSPRQAGVYAQFAIENDLSVILDLSEFTDTEAQDFTINYFKALWKHAGIARKPYHIILEEAHEFVPQMGGSKAKELFTRIALRGRKRGLGMILVSQRSAKVAKDVLTQCSLYFLHRVVHPTDMSVYRDIIPLPAPQVESMVSGLETGQAVMLSGNEPECVQIRKRHTFHAGATPEFGKDNTPKLLTVDDALLKQLQEMASKAKDEDDELATLQKLIVQKDSQIEDLQHQVEQLEQDVRTLSRLSLSVEMPEIPAPVVQVVEHFQKSEAEKIIVQDKPVENWIVDRQQKQFDVLLHDIRKLPTMHKTIIKFLLERENSQYDAASMARWIGVSASTIINKPPLQAIELGVITRFKSSRTYYYKSAARQKISSEFPALRADRLIDSIVSAC